jgi:tRNA threonylcarbamoyladenosine biosynthesis protein TsaB
MNLLIIDASTKNLSICLVKNNRVIALINKRGKFLASKIISILEKIIRSSGFNLNKTDAIVVGIGPGSFTGLRVSLAIAKALNLSLNKPIIPISSFTAIINQVPEKHKKVAVIADARKNLIYAATYQFKNNAIQQKTKETLAILPEFIASHKDHFFITNDSHLREAALKIDPKLRFHPKDIYPIASYLVDLTLPAKKLMVKSIQADMLKPLYLHKQNCQVRKN